MKQHTFRSVGVLTDAALVVRQGEDKAYENDVHVIMRVIIFTLHHLLFIYEHAQGHLLIGRQ